jgi:hypothetical protein
MRHGIPSTLDFCAVRDPSPGHDTPMIGAIMNSGDDADLGRGLAYLT